MSKGNTTLCGEVSLYKYDDTRIAKKRFYSIWHCKTIVHDWRLFFGEAKFKTFYYQASFLNNETDGALDNLIDKVVEKQKLVYNSEVLYL